MGPETTGRKRRWEPPGSSRHALTRAIDDSLGVSARTRLPSTGRVKESSSSIVRPGDVAGVGGDVPEVHTARGVTASAIDTRISFGITGKYYRLNAKTPRRNDGFAIGIRD